MIIKKLAFSLFFSLLLLTTPGLAQGSDILNHVLGSNNIVPDSREVFGSGNGTLLGERTILQDYSTVDNFSKVSGNTNDPNYEGAYQVRNFITVIIQFIEKMMVPVAIIFLLWAALNLLIQRGDEEQFSKRIRQVIWTGVGFMMFAFAFAIVDYMFFGVQGQILQGDNIELFGKWTNREVMGFIQFISSFAVAIAVFFLVFGAVQLILLGEQEEQMSKIKRQIIFTILGILMIAFANTIASIFFAGTPGGDISVDSTLLIREAVRWINIILGFIALGAVIAIIWAGIQMIIHFGNEEALGRSKKIILYAIIGLVLAFSAFSIVRFFLSPGTYSSNDPSNTSQLEVFDRGIVNP